MFRRAGKLREVCCGTKAGKPRRWICRRRGPAPCLRRPSWKSSELLRRMNIGIDLGTTNSALAFIDPQQAAEADAPAIQIQETPQYVAQGRIEARRTLPSFLYLGDREYIGAYAREQGAIVPTKSVHSAKSWLSNSEVDRTAKILPWDAQEGGRVLSPVEVSTHILAYLGDEWKQQHGSAVGEQNVVL